MVLSVPTMVTTGNGESGFDSGEGAERQGLGQAVARLAADRQLDPKIQLRRYLIVFEPPTFVLD